MTKFELTNDIFYNTKYLITIHDLCLAWGKNMGRH